MKKTLALLLALAMVLSLCACGEKTEPSPVAPKNDDIVEFQDVILVDNDTIALELVDFHVKEYKWQTGTEQEKLVTFKATNKTDHKISMNPSKFYIDNEEVHVSMVDGSIAPDAGKAGRYSFIINYQGSSDHNPLQSLDELYKLEGSFSGIHVYDDASKNKSFDVAFNIQAAINGEVAVAESSEPEQLYAIGDTVATDTVEFTLTGFNYVHHLNPKTYAEKKDNAGGSLGPGQDMVFANPEYTIKNLAKTSDNAYKMAKFTIDYNDGYIFGMFDHVSYMVDVPGVTRKFAGEYSSQGTAMELSPLSQETYEFYIPANSAIETDQNATLLLKVTLSTSSGTKDFVYKIR